MASLTSSTAPVASLTRQQSSALTSSSTKSIGWQPQQQPRRLHQTRAASEEVVVVTETPVRSSPPASTSGYRVSMFDALRFNGPAPELVNGRLAMVGFLAGAIEEASSGETIAAQVAHLSPLAALALAAVVYGSMVPVLKGAKNEPFGFFTPKAERLNGRAAMLAFAVLLALESKSGVCFF